jgi:hypothetical protein
MASGNVLFILVPLSSSPPATAAAQIDIIVGTSAPVEWFPVIAFDTTTVEYADFHGLVMPAHYGGGGITCSIRSSAGATTGTLQWAIALREIADDAEDLDTTAQTYDYNVINIATLASAIGELTYDNITFTSGADMDNVGAGDSFSLRIRRDTGSDTLATDAYIHSIYITET